MKKISWENLQTIISFVCLLLAICTVILQVFGASLLIRTAVCAVIVFFSAIPIIMDLLMRDKSKLLLHSYFTLVWAFVLVLHLSNF